MIRERGTMDRTMERLAAAKLPRSRNRVVRIDDGKASVGVASTHRTRAGVKFNMLARLYLRTHRDA